MENQAYDDEDYYEDYKDNAIMENIRLKKKLSRLLKDVEDSNNLISKGAFNFMFIDSGEYMYQIKDTVYITGYNSIK